MDFDFSPDQQQLKEQARRYLADHCSSQAVRAVLDGPQSHDAALWKGLGDTGLPGRSHPRRPGRQRRRHVGAVRDRRRTGSRGGTGAVFQLDRPGCRPAATRRQRRPAAALAARPGQRRHHRHAGAGRTAWPGPGGPHCQPRAAGQAQRLQAAGGRRRHRRHRHRGHPRWRGRRPVAAHRRPGIGRRAAHAAGQHRPHPQPGADRLQRRRGRAAGRCRRRCGAAGHRAGPGSGADGLRAGGRRRQGAADRLRLRAGALCLRPADRQPAGHQAHAGRHVCVGHAGAQQCLLRRLGTEHRRARAGRSRRHCPGQRHPGLPALRPQQHPGAWRHGLHLGL